MEGGWESLEDDSPLLLWKAGKHHHAEAQNRGISGVTKITYALKYSNTTSSEVTIGWLVAVT